MRCVCLVAAASAVAAASSALGENDAHRCSWEHVGECIQSDTSVEDPALGLLQRSLRKHLREATLGEISANETRAEGRLSDHVFKSRVQACLHDSTGVPFAVGQRAELQLFQEFGLVDQATPRCRAQSLMALHQTRSSLGLLSLDEVLPEHTVEQRNHIAYVLTVVWSVVAVILVLWSVTSVMKHPRKTGRTSASAKELNLADEETAWNYGLWHWLSLSWADDLMGRYGKTWSSVIDEHEISWENGQDLDYQPYITFKKYWHEQVKLKGMEQASIPYALYKTVGVKATVALVSAVILDALASNVGMVIALEKFLTCLEAMSERQKLHPDEPIDLLEPTIYIVAMVFGIPMLYRTCSVLCSLLDGYYTNVCAAGLASIVFEKAMDLPAGSAPPKPTDDDEDPHKNMDPNVVQLLNVDIIEAWSYLLKTVVYCAFSPVLVIIMFSMLVRRIHLAGFVGFLYCIPVMCFELGFVRINIGLWMQYQGFMDRRLQYLTETILHVRTIKCLALESLSFEKLNKARVAELAFNQRCQVLGGFIGAVSNTIPWGCLLTAMYFLLATEGSIAAWKILIVQRLMGSLLGAIGAINSGIHKFIAIPNSFKRIQRYLCQQDRPRDNVKAPGMAGGEPVVRLKGNFAFVPDKPTLTDIDVEIRKGEAVAIIGSVASGKSALLQTILGELFPACEGTTIEAPRVESKRIAFCSQVPWIFEGTLRENVLAGEEMDKDRYYQALYASCLTQDLEILPGGDQVSIGSYGVRLSGGQRARVALARAAYRDCADLVIMDDPFASVDAPTGQHLCDKLLLGPLMQDRTRVVVMQPSSQRLQKFDRVILVENGRVVESGRPEQVIESEAFARLQSSIASAKAPTKKTSPRSDHWTMGAQAVGVIVDKQEGSASDLREVEDQDNITWETIKWWLGAAGAGNIAFFLGMILAQRLLGLYQSVTVAQWIDTKMKRPVDDTVYMWRIIFWTAMQCVGIALTMYAASRVSIAASTKMHAKVIHNIVRAPIDKFHDKQPSGRLINRLSFDMRQVDDSVPWVLSSIFGFLTGFCVTEIYILQVMPWQYVVAALPCMGVALFFIYVFRGTAVPLVFHSKHTLSTVQDLQALVLTTQISIRANGMLDNFMAKYNGKSATVIRCQYLIYHVCTAWVQSRIFLVFSVLTTLFAVGGLHGGLNMGTLSVVIALSFQQQMDFEGLSMLFVGALNTLNALQRVTRYFEIPQEAADEVEGDPAVRVSIQVERDGLVPLEICEGPEAEVCPTPFTVCSKGRRPLLVESSDRRSLELVSGCTLADLSPALAHLTGCFTITSVNSTSKDARAMAEELCNPSAKVWLELWNSKYATGLSLAFENVAAGYAIEKSVLHNVSFAIEPRMKVGFAGKTGCGKSTSLLCILRILEARSGRIMLGDMDAKKLGLRALRNIVGLVPQDPVIFEGTWRYNIDPFNKYPDGLIWEALRCVHLMPCLRSLPDGIETKITKDGANMSFGQRQLLSLARMAIRQPPVLLLDECTSALDPVTQETVQETILTEFPMSTIIAIAHRVETILKFDRVVVFDEGRVVEDDTIEKVLQIPNGIFKSMVDATGHH